MNEDLILLEKLQDILDDLDFIVESDIETFIRLKLMEVISELDQKVSTFEEWADEVRSKKRRASGQSLHQRVY